MRFHILTLFPDMVEQGLNTSIIGRAVEKGILSIEAVNIRDYTLDRHKKVDDYPYGGGAGMVMQAQPIYDAWQAIVTKIGYRPRTVYLTPQGPTFHQGMAKEYAKEEDLILLCGHYEGVDQRVIDKIVDEEISLGDFVLTGGELPAVVLVDGIARMLEGTLGHENSCEDESHFDGLLEYPQYTRPEVWEGMPVPDVLLSGHRENILKWRRYKKLEETYKKRPELLKNACLDLVDKANLSEISAILDEHPHIFDGIEDAEEE